jgi:hypothetical protein
MRASLVEHAPDQNPRVRPSQSRRQILESIRCQEGVAQGKRREADPVNKRSRIALRGHQPIRLMDRGANLRWFFANGLKF